MCTYTLSTEREREFSSSSLFIFFFISFHNFPLDKKSWERDDNQLGRDEATFLYKKERREKKRRACDDDDDSALLFVCVCVWMHFFSPPFYRLHTTTAWTLVWVFFLFKFISTHTAVVRTVAPRRSRCVYWNWRERDHAAVEILISCFFFLSFRAPK